MKGQVTTLQNLRIHNRKVLNAHFDECVSATILEVRRDLVAQDVEAKSLANQLDALRDVLNGHREQHLAQGDEMAQRGIRIKEVRREGKRLVADITKYARSPTFSGTSGNKGGRSQGL